MFYTLRAGYVHAVLVHKKNGITHFTPDVFCTNSFRVQHRSYTTPLPPNYSTYYSTLLYPTLFYSTLLFFTFLDFALLYSFLFLLFFLYFFLHFALLYLTLLFLFFFPTISLLYVLFNEVVLWVTIEMTSSEIFSNENNEALA